MNSKKIRATLSLFTLLSLLSATQISITTTFGQPSKLKENSSHKSAVKIYGELATTDNKPIIVNDNLVLPGTTILSGSTIATPAGVSAVVVLEPIGRLDLAPETEVTISYSEELIELKLTRRCVILTTNPGTQGKIIINPDKVVLIGPDERDFIDVCKGDRDDSPPIIGEGAANKAGAGICFYEPTVAPAGGFSPLWLFAGAVPITGIAFGAKNGGSPDPLSQSTP